MERRSLVSLTIKNKKKKEKKHSGVTNNIEKSKVVRRMEGQPVLSKKINRND